MRRTFIAPATYRFESNLQAAIDGLWQVDLKTVDFAREHGPLAEQSQPLGGQVDQTSPESPGLIVVDFKVIDGPLSEFGTGVVHCNHSNSAWNRSMMIWASIDGYRQEGGEI